MRFDHLGYAVQDLDKALHHFKELLGESLGESERYFEPAFESHIQFIQPGGDGPRIELIAPSEAQSLVARILKKRGPGLYHACYRVDDLEMEAARMATNGWRATAQPCNARAFGGQRVQFFFHPELGLIELLESAN